MYLIIKSIRPTHRKCDQSRNLNTKTGFARIRGSVNLNANMRIGKRSLLKQNLEMLSELMRQTGMGALPLLSIENPPPTEEQIMSDVTKSVEVLYARLQRNQEVRV
ncbi:hypothetical protein BDZ89DRAFT_1069170 [Hymenopellis radicata]|nr:hypothetical protein BDZ89DRAFT_1069170 [Hymenopellis radicata]